MKPITINAQATIKEGKLAGISGRVIGADFTGKEVTLVVDRHCYVSTHWDNVQQTESEDQEAQLAMF